MIELLNHIGRLWWAWTASMFWQVGLLILLIGCIDLLTRKWAWPQLRYALWSLILVKLILPPTLSLPSGVIPELRPVAGQVVRWLDSEKPAVGARPAAISGFGFGIADSVLSVNPQFKGFTMSTGGVVKIEDPGDGSPVARPSRPCSFLLDARAGRPRHEENHRQASLDDTTQRVNTDSMIAANPQPAIANHVTPDSDPGPQLEWQFYAMMIWLLGTLILGIWLFLRLHSVAGRQGYRAAAASLPQSFYNHLADCSKRLELRRIPRVVVTKRLTSPAVFGVFSPVLLVPKGYLGKLSRRDTEHMLLHELAHIKRGDLVMHGLYLLLQIVYWYNPLLWLVRRHMHHLRELSCDGTVAELLRERTAAYRQTLLETARRLLTTSVEPGLGLLGLFEDSNHLLVRLNWLTKPTWRYSTMKRAIVATIAVLMFACVLPMAQGRESASKEQAPTVVREQDQPSQDQLSQDIAKLQAQLEQLMAQQQELQKQLRALAEQRNQLRAEPREPAVRREATRGRPQRPQKQQAPRDVTVAPPEAPAAPAAEERVSPESREQLKHVQEQVQHAKDEAKRTMKEAARAQQEAERAQAEANVQAQAEDQQDWAKTMRAHGDQMKKWSQSEEMRKWHEDMANWGQQMGRWGQQFGSRQTGEAMNDAEQHPMPPIAVHVPEIHMPAVEPPAIDDKQDGREEVVSRLEQAVDLPAGRLLELANEIGSISVRGDDEPGCKITATVKVKADTKEEAQRIVDQVKLVVTPSVVTPSDDKVRVSLTKPEIQDKQKGISCQVVLEVTVPRKVQIKASQAVGDIRLTNLRGSVDASAKVGSIRATDVAGRVALSADVGGVEFTAPKDFSAKVQAKANIGSIQSDLPLEVAKPRGVAMGSSATGTIGGGDGELSLKTNVGSIRIRSQGPEPRPRPEPRSQPTPESEF